MTEELFQMYLNKLSKAPRGWSECKALGGFIEDFLIDNPTFEQFDKIISGNNLDAKVLWAIWKIKGVN